MSHESTHVHSESITSILDTNNNSAQNISEYLNMNKRAIQVLQEEVSLMWIIFGTIGNLLSLLVLCTRKMRIHSTFTYLTVLAVCDTLVLYFGLLRDFLVNKYKIDVDGELLCKFHVFSFYFVLHMASWLLVAVNVDRLIAASFLSLSKKWCTPRTAIKVCLVLAVCLVFLNLHFLYFVDSSTNRSKSTNEKSNMKIFKLLNGTALNISDISINLNQPKPNDNQKSSNLDHFFNNDHTNENLLSESLNHFSTFLSTKLVFEDESSDKIDEEAPINPYVYRKCLIKAKTPKYKYFFHNMFTWIDASAQVILPFIVMVICNINIIHKVLLTKNKTNGKNLKRIKKIKNMCIMIVSVSVIFFILEAPVLIFICLMQGQWIPEDWKYIELVWTIMNLMMYTNHVINFFSYCMTGTKFRRELLRLMFVHNLIKVLTGYKNISLFRTNSNNKNNIQANDCLNKANFNNEPTRFIDKNEMKQEIEIEIDPRSKAYTKRKSKKVNFEILNLKSKEKNIKLSLTNRIIDQKMKLGASSTNLDQDISEDSVSNDEVMVEYEERNSFVGEYSKKETKLK